MPFLHLKSYGVRKFRKSLPYLYQNSVYKNVLEGNGNVIQQLCLFSHSSGSLWEHYKVLGITTSATKKQIKEAYLEKCKLYHPDKHPGNKVMHEKFVKIKQAYDALKDHQPGSTIPKQPNRRQEPYNYYSNSNYYQKYGRRTATWDDVIKEQQENHRIYKEHMRKKYEKQDATMSRNRNDTLNDYWDYVYSDNFKKPKVEHKLSERSDLLFVLLIFIICSSILKARIDDAKERMIMLERIKKINNINND